MLLLSERLCNDTKMLYGEGDRAFEFTIILSLGGKETGQNSHVTELFGRQTYSRGQFWTCFSVYE